MPRNCVIVLLIWRHGDRSAAETDSQQPASRTESKKKPRKLLASGASRVEWVAAGESSAAAL